jgi:hypothetical protein
MFYYNINVFVWFSLQSVGMIQNSSKQMEIQQLI